MSPGESVQILHVDGDAAFAETAAASLERIDQRFQVLVAADFREARTVLDEYEIDCIVSDYDSSEQTGLDFLDDVRERDPELPFILFTGNGTEEIASEAISRGVTDYLQKEDSRDQFTVLADRIKDAVDQYHSQQERTESRERREQQLEQHRENLEQLHTAANRLYVADSVEECYEITIDAAVTILGFDWCTLTAPADNGEEFEIVAVSEDTPLEVGDRPFGLEEGIAGHVYQTKEPSVVNNAVEEERGKPVTDTIRSGLTIPIGEWGVFQAVTETTEAFDEQDRKHAELLVSSMIAAVDRLEQQSEIRARQAELERQNERLDQFASVVSHDLRNPLNVATGRLALASDECNSEHLDHIEKAHDRMETLIDDLLALAREGERVDDPDIVELSEVTRRCWAHVATKDATLRVDTEQPIEADRGRLEQLLENLVRNAVEHASTNDQRQGEDTDETDDEGITVTVGSLEGGFFIEDDGPGIPEGERDQIFNLGYSTAEGGTGFGLSIVEQVADAHDWSIAVTESTDGGARFEISGVRIVDEPTQ